MASTAAHPAPTSAHFVIPSLDGLRAFSFLMVFAAHAGAWWIPGGFGVTVFFFLSGFLITTLLRMEHERTGRIDLKQFYMRRALRIWPPFYLVLGTGLLLASVGLLHAELHAPSVLAQALHVSNYYVIFRNWRGVVPGSGVYWSLAVEEHFYLLFPTLFIALAKAGFSGKAMARVFASICALVLAWRCALVFVWHAELSRTFVATDTRIDSILFGCCLAVLGNPALDYPRGERPRAKHIALLLAGLSCLVFTFLYRPLWFRDTARYTVQGLALIPIFATAVRFPDWGPMRLLNIPKLGFIGTLSYALYLVHHTVLDVLQESLGSWPWPARALLAFTVSFALAYGIWHFVEEPCAELRRSLGRAMTKRRLAASAEP